MNRVERLMEIFQEAAEAERQARIRYEEAAKLCDDPSLKEVLLAFAHDEERHEQEVIARFQEVAHRLAGGIH